MANLTTDVVGGQDLTSIRAHFDQDGKNIIVASKRDLLYYSVETREQVGRATLNSTKLAPEERIVACEIFSSSLYVFTNNGKIFLWSLESRDWLNELALPVNDNETLVSCKLVSKRQYIYTILDNETNKTTINYSMSRSERERPKQRVVINECSHGQQNTFDIGCLVAQTDLSSESPKRLAKQRCLAYIEGGHVHFQKIAVGEKFSPSYVKKRTGLDLTCVRANETRPMVAVGDVLGRIYVYTGDLTSQDFQRTKLHWHNLPVNDLCFSSTGNTLYSVGGESGCVVIWDLSQDNLGKKRVVARLGMPIRYLNCSSHLNQVILSFEDNEIQIMDTNERTRFLRTLTRRTIDMYTQNDCKALRISGSKSESAKSIGLLWHSKTDTVVTNAKTGWLQFYSPKAKTKIQALNYLKSNILSLEKDGKVVPSDITRATFSLDGSWLAFYETRETIGSFPDVKLHIWQRSSSTNRWVWIQTADRLHSSTSIIDLKFSTDGQFLISVSEDGTFHVLHRVCLDARSGSKSSSKYMYAKGFVGNVPEKLPAMATFSQDSSVMAMSLKNDTTLIWMIVDPYKLVYECQLNQIDTDMELSNGTEEATVQPSHDVLGLHFGYHKPAQSIAPLCEVRSNSIRIWNILSPQETMEYSAADSRQEGDDQEAEFTAVAFDQFPGDNSPQDYFAVCTNKNFILIFKLQISQTTRSMRPLVNVDGNPPIFDPRMPINYTHMCFLGKPILDIDAQCHQDPQIVKLLNRLCLMNNHQELVSITDKLTLEKQSASNGCNAIKTFDMTDLQEYFANSASIYSEETRSLANSDKLDSSTITEKQRKIRNRLQVQKMLKDLLVRIPSQNLPKMEILGPMILNKLV